MSIKKILIADDNVEFCENVADILELEGYQLETVYDGFQALEKVQENGFDLVLMDIKMPVMNGVETFKKLKRIAPQLPVIMITAYAVEDLIREALQQGAFGAFRKPINFEKLLLSIEYALPDGALIMVVNGNHKLYSSLNSVLSAQGYRVGIAEDGDKAVKMTRENNFDIILLDMKLPIMNGLETYLTIRNIRPEAVVIMITGHPQELREMAQQALDQKAYICLEKPLDIEYLLDLLQEIMESKSARDTKNED